MFVCGSPPHTLCNRYLSSYRFDLRVVWFLCSNISSICSLSKNGIESQIWQSSPSVGIPDVCLNTMSGMLFVNVLCKKNKWNHIHFYICRAITPFDTLPWLHCLILYHILINAELNVVYLSMHPFVRVRFNNILMCPKKNWQFRNFRVRFIYWNWYVSRTSGFLMWVYFIILFNDVFYCSE